MRTFFQHAPPGSGIALVLAALLSAAPFWQLSAASVLDQASAPGPVNVEVEWPLMISQTFTPAIGGRLDQIKLFNRVESTEYDPEFVFTYLGVREVNPAGEPGGVFLMERELVARDLTYRFADVSVHLNPGQTYAFELIVHPNNNLDLLPLALGETDYPGGQLWTRGWFDTQWNRWPESTNDEPSDLAFEVRLTPGLPPVRLVRPEWRTWTIYPEPVGLAAMLDPGLPDRPVEYLVNGQIIGTSLSAPHAFTWTPDRVGDLNFSARIQHGEGPYTSVPLLHNVSLATAANDHLGNAAYVVALDQEISWFNGNTTAEPGELKLASGGGRSVWFNWTAPVTGTYTMSGYGRGRENTDFPLAMAVFRGSYPTALNFVGGNTYVYSGNYTILGGGLPYHAWFDAVAGQEYRIMVDSFAGNVGICHWSIGLRPLNDAFERPETFSGSGRVLERSSAGATTEFNEPLAAPATTQRTVWFNWLPLAAGEVTIAVRSDDFMPELEVFTGLDLKSLSPVTALSSTRNDRERTHVVEVARDTAYVLRVASRNGADGVYQVEVRQHAARFTQPVPGQVIRADSFVPLRVTPHHAPAEIDYIDLWDGDQLIRRLDNGAVSHNWLADAGTAALRTETVLHGGRRIESDPQDLLVYVPGRLPVPRVFAGSSRSFAFTAAGALHQWGGYHPDRWTPYPKEKAFGQGRQLIDTGTYSRFFHPQRVPTPRSTGPIRTLALGYGWSEVLLALTEDGRLFADWVEVPPPTGAGEWRFLAHDGAIADDGSIHVWDQDGMVQLTLPPEVANPVQIRFSGFYFSPTGVLVLRADNQLWHVPFTFPLTARAILAPEGHVWREINANNKYGLALSDQGRVVQWEHPASAPAQTHFIGAFGGQPWTKIDSSPLRFVGLVANGEMAVWGSDVADAYSPRPVSRPAGVSAWTDVATGYSHFLAIGDDCAVYSWGPNNYGQLGVGIAPDRVQPAPVPQLSGLCGYPELDPINREDRGIVTFPTLRNQRYNVQYTEDYVQWVTVWPQIVGTGSRVTWYDPDIWGPDCPCPDVPYRFYRVVSLQGSAP